MSKRPKIYYNLKESPFIFSLSENGNEFLYYFSSKLHLDIFNRKKDDFIKNKREAFRSKNRGLDISTSAILFILYKKVENRGCYVIRNGNIIDTYILS